MNSVFDVIIATASEADRRRLAAMLRQRTDSLRVETSAGLDAPVDRLTGAAGTAAFGAAPAPRRGCVLTDVAALAQTDPQTRRRLFARGDGLATVVILRAGDENRRIAELLGGDHDQAIESFPWREVDAGERGLDALLRAVRHAVEIADLEAKLGRRAEEIARLNQALSHDLSAPIGSLQRLLDLSLKALAGDDGATARNVVQRARAAAKRAGRLIKALEAHAVSAEPIAALTELEATPLREIIDAAAAAVGAELSADDGGRAEFSIRTTPLPVAKACRRRLSQVIEEVLRNAATFNDADAPLIEIHGRETEDAAEVTFEDNGLGVDAAYLETIFEPLTRLHGPQSYPGSGLGLATARRLMAEMGGRIWAENRAPGSNGLRIRLVLPR